jgi:hypothetical protein
MAEAFAAHHHRPDNARILVGERNGRDVHRPTIAQARQPSRPAEPYAAAAPTHDGAGTMDQQFAKVTVVALAHPAQPLLATARVLARDEAEPGGELTGGAEMRRIADGGHDRGCGDRADARNSRQAPADFVGAMPSQRIAFEFSQLALGGVQLPDQQAKRFPGPVTAKLCKMAIRSGVAVGPTEALG